jgi:hypothetical protein
VGKNSLYQRALVKAHHVLGGGTTELCRYLRVSPLLLSRWLSGEEEMPEVVFLRVVDLVLKEMDGDEQRDIAHLLEQVAKTKEAVQRK